MPRGLILYALPPVRLFRKRIWFCELLCPLRRLGFAQKAFLVCSRYLHYHLGNKEAFNPLKKYKTLTFNVGLFSQCPADSP